MEISSLLRSAHLDGEALAGFRDWRNLEQHLLGIAGNDARLHLGSDISDLADMLLELVSAEQLGAAEGTASGVDRSGTGDTGVVDTACSMATSSTIIHQDPHLQEHIHFSYKDPELPPGVWVGPGAQVANDTVPLMDPSTVEQYSKRQLVEYLRQAAPLEILMRYNFLGSFQNAMNSNGASKLADAVNETWKLRGGAAHEPVPSSCSSFARVITGGSSEMIIQGSTEATVQVHPGPVALGTASAAANVEANAETDTDLGASAPAADAVAAAAAAAPATAARAAMATSHTEESAIEEETADASWSFYFSSALQSQMLLPHRRCCGGRRCCHYTD